MARHGGYKSEKRRKETARLKKQEEKRQRRFGAKTQNEEAGDEIESAEGVDTESTTTEHSESVTAEAQ